jgi:hypothetical protein
MKKQVLGGCVVLSLFTAGCFQKIKVNCTTRRTVLLLNCTDQSERVPEQHKACYGMLVAFLWELF